MNFEYNGNMWTTNELRDNKGLAGIPIVQDSNIPEGNMYIVGDGTMLYDGLFQYLPRKEWWKE